MARHGRHARNTTSGEGGHLAPGDFFGEFALTDRKHKRATTMTARGPEPLQLLCISRETLDSNPRLAAWRKKMINVKVLPRADGLDTGASEMTKPQTVGTATMDAVEAFKPDVGPRKRAGEELPVSEL